MRSQPTLVRKDLCRVGRLIYEDNLQGTGSLIDLSYILFVPWAATDFHLNYHGRKFVL